MVHVVVQKYGPTVLAAPTTTGFDRTAWIVPFVALFMGFGIVVLVVRAWKNRPAPKPFSPAFFQQANALFSFPAIA